MIQITDADALRISQARAMALEALLQDAMILLGEARSIIADCRAVHEMGMQPVVVAVPVHH